MKYPIIFFLIITTWISFNGCEQAIRFDRPDYKSKAVVWSFAGADSTPRAVIYKTLPIQGWVEQDRDQQFIRDLQATFTLNQEAQLLELGEEKVIGNGRGSFRYGHLDSINLPFYYSDIKPQIGDKIALDFTYEDVDYHAESFIPNKVTIDQVEETQVLMTDILDSWSVEVYRVYFRDNANEENAYRIKVRASGWNSQAIFDDSTGQIVGYDNIFLESIAYGDPTTDDENNGERMYVDIPKHKLAYFDFNPIEVKDSLDNIIERYFILEVQVEVMDRKAGKYLQSVTQQNYASGDPLAEAVFLKGNIENGLGIFSGYNISDTVHVKLY